MRVGDRKQGIYNRLPELKSLLKINTHTQQWLLMGLQHVLLEHIHKDKLV